MKHFFHNRALPGIQLAFCWLLKRPLVKMMRRNGFIIDNRVQARQLQRFFFKRYA